MPTSTTRHSRWVLNSTGRSIRIIRFGLILTAGIVSFLSLAPGQLVDQTLAPNTAKAGIFKSLLDEAGAGRGDAITPGSSIFLIQRDPFRSVRRG